MWLLERLLRAPRPDRAGGASSHEIARPAAGGFLDSIQIDASGIIRITGWSLQEFDVRFAPAVRLDAVPVPLLQHFRFSRPDVVWKQRPGFSHAGLALDYLIPESMPGRASTLDLDLDEDRHLHITGDFQFLHPHYRPLFNVPEVLHRNQIYGSGPPNAVVNSEVLDLARELPGPLLDFGCGQGALLGELRRLGIDAYGLELDSEMIRRAIPAEVRDAITLYDGRLPSPFEDGQFRSVFCSEVLEHISDYEAAIADIARVATEQVVFTVPDASAIPLGFRHGVVPWHLLEATHVNFFNQQSLARALRHFFPKIEFGRIGRSHFNDTGYYVSLVAVCWK